MEGVNIHKGDYTNNNGCHIFKPETIKKLKILFCNLIQIIKMVEDRKRKRVLTKKQYLKIYKLKRKNYANNKYSLKAR